MKKATGRKVRSSPGRETMRPEYDFSGGVRGKHAAAYKAGPVRVITALRPAGNVSVTLDEDVAAAFPDSESVNTALRGLLRLFRAQQRRVAGRTGRPR